MLRVGVAQAGCNPRVILMDLMHLGCAFLDHKLVPWVKNTLENKKRKYI